MRRWRLLLGLAGALIGSAVAWAQVPVVTVPEDAELTQESEADLDDYALPVAPFTTAEPTVRVTGSVTRRAWRMPAGGRTVVSVLAEHRRALQRQGLRRLLDCRNEECGGFDFRFGVSLLPPPAMVMDVRDFGQLTLGREDPAAYISILVSRVRTTIFVQAVTVTPADPALSFVAEPLDPAVQTEPQAGHDETADVPEEVEPAPDTGDERADEADGGSPPLTPEGDGDDVPQDGRPLLDRLLAYGHVPVAGLAFESGGATLTESSGGALDEMASMLMANPDLKVAIVGHSDNVGPLDVNIEVSRRRAEAVRSALIERGVDGDRLEARGVGYLAPRRSNATEEGRALNRRVELVLR